MRYTIGAAMLLMALVLNCLPKRAVNVFSDPHFYYDEENYTLIRVNPETRDADIQRYNERTEKKMFKDFEIRHEPDTLKEQDTPPRVRKMVVPKYPSRPAKEGYSARIILKLLVSEQGIVVLAKPASGAQKLDEIGRAFIKASLEAAILTEFYPAQQKGEPVRIWITYPMQFVIDTR